MAIFLLCLYTVEGARDLFGVPFIRALIPFMFFAVSCLVSKSCLILCDPMDCSLSGSSVHGISQARILEWVAFSFSRDLPDPGKGRTHVSHIGRWILYR